MKTTLTNVVTFIATVGCGAMITIASTAAITHESSLFRPAAIRTAPHEVIRLDPVVVTISKSGYEAARKEMLGDTHMARDNNGKVRHG